MWVSQWVLGLCIGKSALGLCMGKSALGLCEGKSVGIRSVYR